MLSLVESLSEQPATWAWWRLRLSGDERLWDLYAFPSSRANYRIHGNDMTNGFLALSVLIKNFLAANEDVNEVRQGIVL